MPEGRFLSKSISSDWNLNQCSIEADYLFARCIPHLDREGRMTGHPGQIKGLVVPLRAELDPIGVDRALGELAAAGLVVWYEVEGKPYLCFPGFQKNQKGLRAEREAASAIPEPAKGRPITTVLRRTPELSGQSEVEVKGSEGKNPERATRVVDVEYTVSGLIEEARTVLGCGIWPENGLECRKARDVIIKHWEGRGVELSQVYAAIHGLRIMVDRGDVEWLKDRKGRPIDGIQALANTRAVIPGADGTQLRPLFSAAVEAYYGQRDQKPVKRGGGLDRPNFQIPAA